MEYGIYVLLLFVFFEVDAIRHHLKSIKEIMEKQEGKV